MQNGKLPSPQKVIEVAYKRWECFGCGDILKFGVWVQWSLTSGQGNSSVFTITSHLDVLLAHHTILKEQVTKLSGHLRGRLYWRLYQGGWWGSHVFCLNFKTSCVGIYKCFTQSLLSEIEKNYLSLSVFQKRGIAMSYAL